jgi:hypothetical protein
MSRVVTYCDTEGKLHTEMTSGPDRRPAYVRYRAIAAKVDAGSRAVFPPPHTYIAPRDNTTNMGYVWFHGWAAGRGAGECPSLHQPRTDFRPSGYKTLTSHWHCGYTIQALDQGENWVPPFTQVLKHMGPTLRLPPTSMATDTREISPNCVWRSWLPIIGCAASNRIRSSS